MKLHPLRPVKTSWTRVDRMTLPGNVHANVYRRLVEDGRLTAIVAREPAGWHLSISFVGPSGSHRYPDWDEIADARYKLLSGDLDFVMHLPPLDEYVSLHPTTFHLHEHPARPA